eukprot:9488851-Pyramimonas_sp.AAC.1
MRGRFIAILYSQNGGVCSRSGLQNRGAWARRHAQVVRAQLDNGEKLIGLQVEEALLPELINYSVHVDYPPVDERSGRLHGARPSRTGKGQRELM